MDREYEDDLYLNSDEEDDLACDYDDQYLVSGNQIQNGDSELSLMHDKINTSLSLVQNITSVYSLHEHRKEVEALTREQLARTVAKYKTAEKFITSSFSERNGVLQNYYSVLDDAVRKGDRELIISAMANISGIVTTSPLKDLGKLCESFDASLDKLLDFD